MEIVDAEITTDGPDERKFDEYTLAMWSRAYIECLDTIQATASLGFEYEDTPELYAPELLKAAKAYGLLELAQREICSKDAPESLKRLYGAFTMQGRVNVARHPDTKPETRLKAYDAIDAAAGLGTETVGPSGGVMIVPMTNGPDDWAKMARISQAALVEQSK